MALGILGQYQPEDRRICAGIPKFGNAFLFKADAYLMLDMVGAETLRSRMGIIVGFKPTILSIRSGESHSSFLGRQGRGDGAARAVFR